MTSKFVLIVDGELKTYTNFDDIPRIIDNVVEFSPEFLPPPHTPEQHEINEKWHERFKELLSRETK